MLRPLALGAATACCQNRLLQAVSKPRRKAVVMLFHHPLQPTSNQRRKVVVREQIPLQLARVRVGKVRSPQPSRTRRHVLKDCRLRRVI